jgi:hypothetical protein
LVPGIRDIQRPVRANGNALRRVQFRSRRDSAIAAETLCSVPRHDTQHTRQRRLINDLPIRVREVKIAGCIKGNAAWQQWHRNRLSGALGIRLSRREREQQAKESHDHTQQHRRARHGGKRCQQADSKTIDPSIGTAF